MLHTHLSSNTDEAYACENNKKTKGHPKINEETDRPRQEVKQRAISKIRTIAKKALKENEYF